MTLSVFFFFFIEINILGFILYLINEWLYSHTPDKEIDTLVSIASVLGGSLGIVIAILLFDRKTVKENLMSRVFVSSVLVIQVVIVLMIKGAIGKDITLAFWDYFGTHKVLLWYLVVMNFVSLIAYALDKIRAIEHASRVRNIILLALAFFGGSIGAITGMYIFRHKTKKDYYTVGVPLIIIMQLVVLFFLMNRKA